MSEKVYVKATDSPFNAAADGVTNDRAAIQAAIDYVYSNGGGTVELDSGKVFMSTGIVIKSNVELHFGDGTMLLQSPFAEEYYKPEGDSYEPYTPIIGHNYSETIKWSHTWYKNYPFIFAPEGSHDFKITGNGTLRMSECDDPTKLVRTCPIGFYRVSNFEISDITINNYHGYAMMPFTCEYGLIKNVKIFEWSFGNGDGICMMNCRHMRVTGCKMFTGDDSVYIFSSYNDPRGSEWWSSAEPQASEDIEIDHNDLESNHCKAFGMILWGIDCPDLEKVEVRDVYVHDNHFKTMGNWLYNPYTTNTAPHPVTSLRFENNVIDAIEQNFFETRVSGMNQFKSMPTILNGDFKDGRVFWIFEKNSEADSVTIHRGEDRFARLGHLEAGRAALCQGLYIKAEEKAMLFAAVSAGNAKGRLFVRPLEGGENVAEVEFANADSRRVSLEFTVPADGNYLVGVESASEEPGSITVTEVEFAGNIDSGTSYNRITKEGGKIIYYYD